MSWFVADGGHGDAAMMVELGGGGLATPHADHSSVVMMTHMALYAAIVLVNKYVLSVLQFTYPTIFQGWQMLAGAIVLQLLALTKKVKITPGLLNTERIAVVQWMPAVFFHVLSIYCGSVALSQLPIPIFIVCHTCIPVVDSIHQSLRKHHSWRSGQNVVLQLLLLVTVALAFWSDPEDRGYGYFWMVLHICASAGYVLFERIEGYSIKLGQMERLYCNFLFSVVLLAPFTYFLGDIMAAQEFQFFSFYSFYSGCLASGVFGALWSVLGVWMSESPDQAVWVGQLNALAKFLVVVLSLFLFEVTFHATHAFWLLTNLVLLIVCEVPFKEVEISETDQHET